MAIKALSYIGVNSDKFEDWSDYSQKSLGMQQVDRGKDILSFRMDDQKQRLTITGDTGDGLGFMVLEVDEKKDLKSILDSKEQFETIIRDYPSTEFAMDAKFKIDLINEILAAKEMYIARYYLKKIKWIPAL